MHRAGYVAGSPLVVLARIHQHVRLARRRHLLIAVDIDLLHARFGVVHQFQKSRIVFHRLSLSCGARTHAQCHLVFPTTLHLHKLEGGPPGPRPTPPSACWRLHDADIADPTAGRGRPARTRGSALQLTSEPRAVAPPITVPSRDPSPAHTGTFAPRRKNVAASARRGRESGCRRALRRSPARHTSGCPTSAAFGRRWRPCSCWEAR